MKTEAIVQKEIRYRSAQDGVLLWRNNVGAAKDENGNYFRYGLANDTPEMARTCKSSDLIGIRPVLITQEMVGHTIGQFVAIECKREGWKETPGDQRAAAQRTFLNLVRDKGGCAMFADRPLVWDTIQLSPELTINSTTL